MPGYDCWQVLLPFNSARWVVAASFSVLYGAWHATIDCHCGCQ